MAKKKPVACIAPRGCVGPMAGGFANQGQREGLQITPKERLALDAHHCSVPVSWGCVVRFLGWTLFFLGLNSIVDPIQDRVRFRKKVQVPTAGGRDLVSEI